MRALTQHTQSWCFSWQIAIEQSEKIRGFVFATSPIPDYWYTSNHGETKMRQNELGSFTKFEFFGRKELESKNCPDLTSYQELKPRICIFCDVWLSHYLVFAAIMITPCQSLISPKIVMTKKSNLKQNPLIPTTSLNNPLLYFTSPSTTSCMEATLQCSCLHKPSTLPPLKNSHTFKQNSTACL